MPSRPLIFLTSKFLAPAIPFSSVKVKTASTGGWGNFCSCKVFKTSKIIAIPALSSAPKTVVPSEVILSFFTTGLTPFPGTTVSICELSTMGALLIVPGKKPITFPCAVVLYFFPALSTCTLQPKSFNFETNTSWISFSKKDSLSILASSTKVSTKRF